MLCTSQASTTICSTMDSISLELPTSSSSSATARLGGRAIDRHNPIIRDGRRFTPPPSPNPKLSTPRHHHTQKTKLGGGLVNGGSLEKSKKKNKKPSESDRDKSPTGGFSVTPPGSTRYLLSDPVFFDGLVDSDPVPVPVDSDDDQERITRPALDFNEDRALTINASKALSSSSSLLETKNPDFFDGFLDYDPVLSPDNSIYDTIGISPSESSQEDKQVATLKLDQSSSPRSPFSDKKISSNRKQTSDQVVVLRVSLHCKGCAGKVRKHLSKMQGVTSFNIDFPAKKVTVTGDVTPLGVLASISKVKNAQFWPEIDR